MLGDKVTNNVLGILNHGGDVSPFNDTNICLIPKIKHPIYILRIIDLSAFAM